MTTEQLCAVPTGTALYAEKQRKRNILATTLRAHPDARELYEQTTDLRERAVPQLMEGCRLWLASNPGRRLRIDGFPKCYAWIMPLKSDWNLEQGTADEHVDVTHEILQMSRRPQ
jgi:hypothetical protein